MLKSRSVRSNTEAEKDHSAVFMLTKSHRNVQLLFLLDLFLFTHILPFFILFLYILFSFIVL